MREIARQIDPKAGKKRKRTTDTTGLAERFVIYLWINKNVYIRELCRRRGIVNWGTNEKRTVRSFLCLVLVRFCLGPLCAGLFASSFPFM